ncbi:MAG: hypothetical protein R3B93_08600 [Bacteroidia bacterium]
MKYLPNSKHFLIVTAPALERWLIQSAENLGVSMDNYGFRNEKVLKNATKSIHAERNQNLKQFLNTLKQKNNSPFKIMTLWIDTIIQEKGNIEKIKLKLKID